jgi:hypothetical protein
METSESSVVMEGGTTPSTARTARSAVLRHAASSHQQLVSLLDRPSSETPFTNPPPLAAALLSSSATN